MGGDGGGWRQKMMLILRGQPTNKSGASPLEFLSLTSTYVATIGTSSTNIKHHPYYLTLPSTIISFR